jgi:hypothetical protein
MLGAGLLLSTDPTRIRTRFKVAFINNPFNKLLISDEAPEVPAVSVTLKHDEGFVRFPSPGNSDR